MSSVPLPVPRLHHLPRKEAVAFEWQEADFRLAAFSLGFADQTNHRVYTEMPPILHITGNDMDEFCRFQEIIRDCILLIVWRDREKTLYLSQPAFPLARHRMAGLCTVSKTLMSLCGCIPVSLWDIPGSRLEDNVLKGLGYELNRNEIANSLVSTTRAPNEIPLGTHIVASISMVFEVSEDVVGK